ncbi:hypothetical protein BU251_06560 [Candidatus Velamenicoccus archaeovorus]|uniref:beta-lactamase n=1 Tax=Velamenicoccus archaeovorus TaxID=1930593 RepID=A0A410P5I7_VELA1|nr:serine hydrolase [Candidatus Velamenicoccus archaeovorus]QAT17403.1 hypothetical protein BU251_06560 [Candidatus Velamenicoccus archaeovorus]
MKQRLQYPIHNRRGKYLALLLSFIVGILSGISGQILLNKYLRNKGPTFQEIRKGGYAFISPLIDCETQEVMPELINFRKKIADAVRRLLDNKEALDISIYFRDLNNGPSFSINENKGFSPGSLLKIPVMMAYFKKAETDPDILKKTLTYQAKPTDNVVFFEPAQKLKSGESYTIEELIRRMIIYSDNEAASLLVENDKTTFSSVQKNLGIEYWEYDQPPGTMRDRSYASLFRVLFNASYLNAALSEKALELLSETQFPFGLRAGVPAEIKVAHKFGERGEGLVLYLHDCGIIYYPRHPYLLCIMTKGGSMKSLDKIIQEISRLVYEEVDRQASAS